MNSLKWREYHVSTLLPQPLAELDHIGLQWKPRILLRAKAIRYLGNALSQRLRPNQHEISFFNLYTCDLADRQRRSLKCPILCKASAKKLRDRLSVQEMPLPGFRVSMNWNCPKGMHSRGLVIYRGDKSTDCEIKPTKDHSTWDSNTSFREWAGQRPLPAGNVGSNPIQSMEHQNDTLDLL